MGRVINVGAEAAAGASGEFKLIPVNTKLRVSVFDIEEGVTGPNSKYPGEAQFTYTAKVTEDGEFKGRELRYNRVPLHAKGNDAWKLATFAAAVGWDVSEAGEVTVPDNLNEVLGTEFTARVGQEKSQKINEATGEPYVNNKVTGTLPLKAGDGAPAKSAEKPTWDKL